jgi:hypothetical protein
VTVQALPEKCVTNPDGRASHHPEARSGHKTRVIVPRVPDAVQLQICNPPFDPAKPTFAFYDGGDCATGGAFSIPSPPWDRSVNLLAFIYVPPYSACGDLLISYLSLVAPDYDRPIQIGGFSTGGMPAMESALRLNTMYRDPRHAVTQVALLDATCDYPYALSIKEFVEHPVSDQAAKVENYYVAARRHGRPYEHAVNIRLAGNHRSAPTYYFVFGNPPLSSDTPAPAGSLLCATRPGD